MVVPIFVVVGDIFVVDCEGYTVCVRIHEWYKFKLGVLLGYFVFNISRVRMYTPFTSSPSSSLEGFLCLDHPL